jgi:hypothetical protein
MQKTLASLLAGALALLAPAAHALIVTLTPSSTTVAPGGGFTVEVVASQVFDGLDPAAEVLAFGFDVAVSDPARAVFTGASVGTGFDDDSAVLPETDVAGSALPGLTADPIVLATLSFQAGLPGVVQLGIVSTPADSNEGLTYFLAEPRALAGSVTVTVVPEPSTSLLLGAGAAILIGFGTRRRSRG